MTKDERDRWKRVMLWEESEEVQRSQFRVIIGVVLFTILASVTRALWEHDYNSLVAVGYAVLSLFIGVALWSAVAWTAGHAFPLVGRLLKWTVHRE